MSEHTPLPIDAVLPELVDALSTHSAVVLRAPAGAGKTTRVPPAILAAGLAGAGRILMLEPRRLAARSAARRISFESGTPVGDFAGFQVRFERCTTPATKIVVATEGVALRQLQSNPLLEGTQVVVFDEFHERHLDADLALAMVKRVRDTLREDLKIVVMSATLDPEPIAEYLGGCPVIDSSGRQYPVEIKYSRQTPDQTLEQQVVAALERTLPKTAGDLLVFLPGVGEIFRVARALEPLARRESLLVKPLYGDLDPAQQDEVLRSAGARKVVLSTNVAETSVTIEGITAVIDSGLARVMRFDPSVGLDRLELSPVSKASADQRAGRAGRMEPGVCVRLWDEKSHRHRPECELAEIFRVDLCGAVLQLKCWGEHDLQDFPWFESPLPQAVEHAEQLLERLGASHQGRVTPLGKSLVHIPVHPRLGRLLIEGQRHSVARRTAVLAALLSERDPFRRDRPTGSRQRRLPPTQAAHRSDSDPLDRLLALEEFIATGAQRHPVGELQTSAARHVERVADQLLRSLDPTEEVAAELDAQRADHAVLLSLLAAYPDRLAKRRDLRSAKGVMVGGKGVKLASQSAVHDAELFLCIDVDSGTTDALVRQASAVSRDWLEPALIRTADELFFHPTQKEVLARRRAYWDDLLLDESPLPVPAGSEKCELLYRHAVKAWEQIFPSKDVELAELVARVRCLGSWLPDLELPQLDAQGMEQVLWDLCGSCRSFAELKQANWVPLVRARLTFAQQQALDREAPQRLQGPGGKNFKLTYEWGRPPVLAAKIQDLFGMRQTPRIARDTVPVLLHLLAPNLRPQQVTDDLASFWKNTYQVIRKELRGRYPKHAWPEDPTA